MTSMEGQLAIARVDRVTPWCQRCPLTNGHGFDGFADAELEFMRGFKVSHQRAWAGETLLEQAASQPRLLTLFSGWAARCRTLPSGERQLINIVLPGDLVGLESVLLGAPSHSIEAITDVTFCSFEPARFRELLENPRMARRLAALQAAELQQIIERFAIVGAFDARRNLAHFICDLHSRLVRLQMAQAERFRLPLTLRQLADALGLTTVHLHRVLRGLRKEGILHLDHGYVHILDGHRLREIGACAGPPQETRPFL